MLIGRKENLVFYGGLLTNKSLTILRPSKSTIANWAVDLSAVLSSLFTLY